MPTITRFEEIEAWQTERELTKMIYSITDTGKISRDFGLKDQLRRASVSVMSNIAEGFESKTQPAFIRYLAIAKASAGEVRSQLYGTARCWIFDRQAIFRIICLDGKSFTATFKVYFLS